MNKLAFSSKQGLILLVSVDGTCVRTLVSESFCLLSDFVTSSYDMQKRQGNFCGVIAGILTAGSASTFTLFGPRGCVGLLWRDSRVHCSSDR